MHTDIAAIAAQMTTLAAEFVHHVHTVIRGETGQSQNVLALSPELCKSGDMESYRANEARLKMREILTAVERGEHIELKRYDTPTGVIVPAGWYEGIQAALDAATGSQKPDPLTSPTSYLIGLVDGMRKVSAPREEEWQRLQRCLGEVRDELVALQEHRELAEALSDYRSRHQHDTHEGEK